MQSLGLLLAIALLVTGGFLNTVVLAFVFLRIIRVMGLIRVRQLACFPGPRQPRQAHPSRTLAPVPR